jgi:hypothetical protein
MNNRSIKLAAIAIALLVLTGCGAAKKMIEEKAGDTLGKAIGQMENEGTKRVEATDYKKKESGGSGSKTNIDDCLKGCSMLSGTGMFSKEFCSDSCWAAVAKDTGDATVCETKVDQGNGLVLFACYLNVAEAKKDAKYCDKIGKDKTDFMRGGCYGNVAKLVKDPAVCEGIKGNMMYDSCLEDAKDGE